MQPRHFVSGLQILAISVFAAVAVVCSVAVLLPRRFLDFCYYIVETVAQTQPTTLSILLAMALFGVLVAVRRSANADSVRSFKVRAWAPKPDFS